MTFSLLFFYFIPKSHYTIIMIILIIILGILTAWISIDGYYQEYLLSIKSVFSHQCSWWAMLVMQLFCSTFPALRKHRLSSPLVFLWSVKTLWQRAKKVSSSYHRYMCNGAERGLHHFVLKFPRPFVKDNKDFTAFSSPVWNENYYYIQYS